ncbi:MAG TPA: hypothetical protein EYG69_03705 [Campylobacterales bacterium]|nr:hypothetical protein [Campylobacterales bacterium]
MYKKGLLTLFTIVTLSFSLSAGEVIDYVDIGIASQKIDNNNFDKGSSLIINAGKENLINDIGLEIEGTFPINKPQATITGVTSSLKFWSMGMYGTYLWKVDKITIKPRLGIVYENIKSAFNTSSTNPTKATDISKIAISGGIGLSYKLTKKYKIYTNYTKFEDDIDHLTFGAEFKF